MKGWIWPAGYSLQPLIYTILSSPPKADEKNERLQMR